MWESALNSEGVGAGVAAIGFAVALVNCFFGFRLQKFWISFMGFLIGAVVAGGLAVQAMGFGAAAAVIGGAAGVLCAWLSFKVYLAGVFLFCAGQTFLFFDMVLSDSGAALAVGIAAGLLVGVLAVKFIRPAVILTSAISGGFAAGGTLAAWIQLPEALRLPESAAPLALGIALALLGMLFQFITAPKKS